MKIWTRLLSVVAMLAAVVFTTLALAQTAITDGDTTINVADILVPWFEIFMPILAAFIAIVLAWLTKVIKEKTGIEIETSRRDALQIALLNAVGLMKARAVASGEKITLDVNHPMLKEAILYVNSAAPQALQYFGLTNEEIAQKLAAKLGLTTTNPPVTNNVTNIPPVSQQ